MVVSKKVRNSPPWWVRAPLYAAVWPRADFEEYRISLQRQYILVRRQNSRRALLRFNLRQCRHWSFAAVQRVVFWLLLVFSSRGA